MECQYSGRTRKLIERLDEVIAYTNRNLKEINEFLDEAERFLEKSRREMLKRYGISMN